MTAEACRIRDAMRGWQVAPHAPAPSWRAATRTHFNITAVRAECLHGVVDDNANPKAATSFPVPMSLAASFSASLAHRVGSAIGREARAMYNLQRQEDGTIRCAPSTGRPEGIAERQEGPRASAACSIDHAEGSLIISRIPCRCEEDAA